MSTGMLTRRRQADAGWRLRGSVSIMIVCLIASLPCLIASDGSARALSPSQRNPYIASWLKEVRKIDKLLLAKDWKTANHRAGNLLKGISKRVTTGGGEVIGAAVVERAVALAGLGKTRDAEWYACLANDLWARTADQLLYYGDIGRRLRRALPGGDQEAPDRKSVVVEEGGGTVILYPSQLRARAHGPVSRGPQESKDGHLTAPVVLRKRQPHFPEGVQLSRGQDTIVVRIIIDEQGIPRSPTIVQGSSYVTLVYTTLDALKDWRFKPATWDGKPIEAVYELEVRFRLSG